MNRPEVSIDNPWTTHTTEVGYENPWIRIDHHTVTTPGGNDGIYGVVHFKNAAVGVLPIDEDDHTWLVGQYRYPLDEYSWEMPEGGCPTDEDPEVAARRELREETGLIAGTLRPLLAGIRLSNSVTNETAFAYVATDLQRTEAEPEDTEDLTLWRLPVDDVIDMTLRGEINDSFTVMAVLRLHAERNGSVS